MRGGRDQDFAAEHLGGRGAGGMQRLLSEVLDLWAATGAAERGRAPLEIIVGAGEDLRIVPDWAKLDTLDAVAKGGIEVAGVAQLGQVTRLRVEFIAEIAGNLADFLPGILLKHDDGVVLPIGDAASAV